MDIFDEPSITATDMAENTLHLLATNSPPLNYSCAGQREWLIEQLPMLLYSVVFNSQVEVGPAYCHFALTLPETDGIVSLAPFCSARARARVSGNGNSFCNERSDERCEAPTGGWRTCEQTRNASG